MARARLEGVRRLRGNEEVARGLERPELIGASPEKAYVRAEDLVAGEREEVGVERLNIDQSVRPVVDRVHEHERSSLVRQAGRARHVHDPSGRVRRERQRDEPHAARARAEEAGQGIEIEASRVPSREVPDDGLDAARLEPEPGADVGFVVELGHDHPVALLESRPQRLRGHADQGGRVQPEDDLPRRRRVEERRDRAARVRDSLVHRARERVVAAALHVPLRVVLAHRVHDLVRDLGAGRVIEEDLAVARGTERRKPLADAFKHR
jgi:hypothetical protein